MPTRILFPAALTLCLLTAPLDWAADGPVASGPDSAAAAATTGEGRTVARPQRSRLSEFFKWPMWPLWACSIALVALVFERVKTLRQKRILDAEMVEDVLACLSERDVEAAGEAAAQSSTLVGRAWAQGLHDLRAGGVALSESLTNATLAQIKPLRHNQQWIGAISTVSPMLGLFGTVIGMVMLFDELAYASGADKAQLAAALSVALLTTVMGLLIAIPGIIVGRYFNGRIARYMEIIEDDINRAHQALAAAQAPRAQTGKASGKSNARPAAVAQT